MRAIVCPKYGSPDVLVLQEVAKPVPKDKEVLVKIHATTVTSGDCRGRAFRSPLLYWLPMRLFLGWTKPRQPILGVELAGEVEAVGDQVKRFKPGERVYALSGMRFGAHVEYVCLREDAVIAHMPGNVAFEEAAAVPFGGTTALHFFRKGKLQRGQRVLVYGASGAVGTAAVQLAKYFGANVTAVCSGVNFALVKSLGADEAILYKRRFRAYRQAVRSHFRRRRKKLESPLPAGARAKRQVHHRRWARGGKRAGGRLAISRGADGVRAVPSGDRQALSVGTGSGSPLVRRTRA